MYAFQFRTEQDRCPCLVYRPGIFIVVVGMIMCLQSSISISWHTLVHFASCKGPSGVALALSSINPAVFGTCVALSQSSLLISSASNSQQTACSRARMHLGLVTWADVATYLITNCHFTLYEKGWWKVLTLTSIPILNTLHTHTVNTMVEQHLNLYTYVRTKAGSFKIFTGFVRVRIAHYTVDLHEVSSPGGD